MRTILSLALLLAFVQPVVADEGTPNAPDLDLGAVELVPVKNPGFPFTDKTTKPPEVRKLRLKVAEQKGNGITDDEAWFETVGASRENTALPPGAEAVPATSKFGKLKFYRGLADQSRLAIYESITPRKGADKDKGLGSIYDQEFSYVAVVLDSRNRVLKAFDLADFFPSILEMTNVDVSGSVLYFDSNYNGYAEITRNKTGYLIAMDLADGRVLWTTPALTASFRGFLLVDDHIIAGYGFTAEPDYLYVVNRHTGAIEQRQKLKSAHDFLYRKGNRLYVRCYDTNYVFEF